MATPTSHSFHTIKEGTVLLVHCCSLFFFTPNSLDKPHFLPIVISYISGSMSICFSLLLFYGHIHIVVKVSSQLHEFSMIEQVRPCHSWEVARINKLRIPEKLHSQHTRKMPHVTPQLRNLRRTLFCVYVPWVLLVSLITNIVQLFLLGWPPLDYSVSFLIITGGCALYRLSQAIEMELR